MSATEVVAADFHEGVNDPSPITRVIALNYYDGPTLGVLQVGDGGSVYRFVLLDQRQVETDDEAELRVFGLYPLPADSLDRLASAVSPHVPPRWPVWCPHWQFPTDEIRQAVEAKTDDIVHRAGPLTWVVVGDLGGGPVRALPVRAARAS
jgi:hypothetical protein